MMLVLSRKAGESVVIEGGIIVEVVAIRGDKVRLGFTAPDEIGIYRKEVYVKRLAEEAEEREKK